VWHPKEENLMGCWTADSESTKEEIEIRRNNRREDMQMQIKCDMRRRCKV
jgi:hypothetical protein